MNHYILLYWTLGSSSRACWIDLLTWRWEVKHVTCDIESIDLKEKLSCPVPARISPTLVRWRHDRVTVCGWFWFWSWFRWIGFTLRILSGRFTPSATLKESRWPTGAAVRSAWHTYCSTAWGQTDFRKLILLFTVDTLNEFKVTVYTLQNIYISNKSCFFYIQQRILNNLNVS